MTDSIMVVADRLAFEEPSALRSLAMSVLQATEGRVGSWDAQVVDGDLFARNELRVVLTPVT